MLQLYHRDRSAWGAPHRDPVSRIKSASHRDKIRVPGMLLTGILEIGVLEVLLIGVLLPSGPDNLAIGTSSRRKGLLASRPAVRHLKERLVKFQCSTRPVVQKFLGPV